MTHKFPLALTAILLIAGLGACSQSTEAPTRDEQSTETPAEPADEATPTAPETRAPEPEPTPTAATNLTAALPEKAPAAAAPDEQLMDDASATGMTARTTRSDQTNQAAPAEQTPND
ncbi:hypothetical protein E2E30_05550 [Sphingomonas sp. AAP5]|uniref:hypothetical protein n=1 Tax=Sphingomonas sp. AAP5 TaxID=1523415 RepID=UPI0010574C2C|nr:hypothetical protein [Sphingomonas sp. AAP5]QBM75281.1 hypothetical protein E2E30_05550 [Sphingomonas sp. AAP5]